TKRRGKSEVGSRGKEKEKCECERGGRGILWGPSDEFSYSLFDRSRLAEANVAHEIIDLGASFRHVSRLHRHEFDFCLPPKLVFEQRDNPRNFDRAIVADIVNSPRRSTRGRVQIAIRLQFGFSR